MTKISDETLAGIYRCTCGFPRDVPHFLVEMPGQAYVVFYRRGFNHASPTVVESWHSHHLVDISWSQFVAECGVDQIRSDVRKFFEEKACDQDQR